VSPPPNNVAADALRGKTASRPLGSQKTLASARLNLKPLGLMKVTLDHNCIIHLSNRTDVGKKIEATVHDKSNQCFVVNIGASEMREQGVRPDQYEKFEELLERAGIAHLPRLHPLMI